MELFAADGHDAGGCERVTGKSGMRPSRLVFWTHRVAICAMLVEGRLHIDGVPQHNHVDDDAECVELVFLAFTVTLPQFATFAVEDGAGQGMATFSPVQPGSAWRDVWPHRRGTSTCGLSCRSVRVWRQLLLPLVLPHMRMLPGCLKRIVPMVFRWERQAARRRGHVEPLSARNWRGPARSRRQGRQPRGAGAERSDAP